MPVPLIIDEDSRDGRLWDAIQSLNATVAETFSISPVVIVRVGEPDVPGFSASDLQILEWSRAHGYSIVTQDENTMLGAYYELVRTGAEMPGLIILKSGHGFRQLAEELILTAQANNPEDLTCQCRFLPQTSTPSGTPRPEA